ncbi:hypothetical protein CR513_35771, partial [Mucuna pruriens]
MPFSENEIKENTLKKNGRGLLRCCTSLLFLWLTGQLFHSSNMTRCPIEDHYWSCIKPLTKAE